MDDVFGLELLQLGRGAGGRELLRASRHRTIASSAGRPWRESAPTSLPHRHRSDRQWPIDAILQPHAWRSNRTLRRVLREADRVLLGEGHLIVLGFIPEPVGMRARRAGPVFRGLQPPALGGRLRDWLVLLGYEVSAAQRYLYALPFEPRARARFPACCAVAHQSPACGRVPAQGAQARLRADADPPRRRDTRACLAAW